MHKNILTLNFARIFLQQVRHFLIIILYNFQFLIWFTVQCWLTDWTELSGEYLRLAVMSELCSALSDCLTVPGLQAPPALLTRRAQHGEMEQGGFPA